MNKLVLFTLVMIAMADMFILGEMKGVIDYKKTCEPMSNNIQQVQWLECDK